ncbi:MAG: hypothetical protein ACJAWH_002230 [Maribacter sp.]|jgi:hypothetical protein
MFQDMKLLGYLLIKKPSQSDGFLLQTKIYFIKTVFNLLVVHFALALVPNQVHPVPHRYTK